MDEIFSISRTTWNFFMKLWQCWQNFLRHIFTLSNWKSENLSLCKLQLLNAIYNLLTKFLMERTRRFSASWHGIKLKLTLENLHLTNEVDWSCRYLNYMNLSRYGVWFVHYVIIRLCLWEAITGSSFNIIPYMEVENPRSRCTRTPPTNHA